MNKTFKAALIGLAAVAAYQLSRLTSLKKADFKVKSIRIPSLSHLFVTVELINNNSFEVTINNFAFDTFFNGVKFGSFAYPNKFLLDANSTKTIEIPVTISPITGFQIITDLLTKNKKEGVLNFNGSVQADGFKFPIYTLYKLW